MARTAWIQELSVPSIWYMSPCVMPVYTFTSSMYTVPVPWAEMTSSPADAVPKLRVTVCGLPADTVCFCPPACTMTRQFPSPSSRKLTYRLFSSIPAERLWISWLIHPETGSTAILLPLCSSTLLLPENFQPCCARANWELYTLLSP